VARILLDECLPRRLANHILGHEVVTVPRAGLAGLKNGELLRRIDGSFDVFVTVARNLPAQNAIVGVQFAVVVIRAASNRLQDLAPLAPLILAELSRARPGTVAVVGA
jgi:hypothetical protein